MLHLDQLVLITNTQQSLISILRKVGILGGPNFAKAYISEQVDSTERRTVLEAAPFPLVATTLQRKETFLNNYTKKSFSRIQN